MGCGCRPYSNDWGGYSQIIGGIYPPIPPGFGTPDLDENMLLREESVQEKLGHLTIKFMIKKLFVKLKSEVDSRTQGSRLKPRTQKKPEAKAKDSPTEDRPSRSQRQECSRPRPRIKDISASALQNKKVFRKNFQAISRKNRFPKNFSDAPQTFNNPSNSAVLKPRTGQFSRT